MAAYRHTPLPNESSIRIFKLVKSRDTRLHGELKIVSLEKKPEYDALSYAWGSSDLTHNIVINNDLLPISNNLHTVLRQFERGIKRHKIKSLWIDAICIDQSSIEEKNHQIMLMDLVYSSASAVLIWLGELTPMTELVMKWFERMHDNAIAAPKNKKEGILNACVDAFEEESKTLCNQKLDGIETVLEEFFSRPWLHRIWTVQEVALARRALLICSDRVWNFGTLITGLLIVTEGLLASVVSNVLVTHGVYTTSLAIQIRVIDTLKRTDNGLVKLKRIVWRVPVADRPPFTRSQILELARLKHAADPRDKVYGLYGLFSALNFPPAAPDYIMDPAYVYTQETRQVIKYENSLEVFYSIRPSKNMPYLPSWVPDWSDSGSPTPTSLVYYAAAGKSVPIFRFFPYDSILRFSPIGVQGRVVDTVGNVSNATLGRFADIKHSFFEKTIAPIQEWAQFCEPGFLEGTAPPATTYREGGYLRDVFWKTLVRGGAPPLDPLSEISLPPNKIQYFNPEKLKVLEAGALCWLGPALSGSAGTLWLRVTGCSPELVTDDLALGVTRVLKGTPKAHDFHKQVLLVSQGLTMLKTSHGLIGTAPPGVAPGDWVTMIRGLRMPFILRRVENIQDRFRILGPCYVHGVMNGEFWNEYDPELDTEFVLI